MQTVAFLTNNFDWASSSVLGLYQARWGMEVFFKQIKQMQPEVQTKLSQVVANGSDFAVP